MLEDLNLEGNPLSDSEKELVDRGLDTLRDYFKQRAAMAIFVSHAVIDYGPYRLADMADYLESKPEVYDVFLCEQDLSGNIDQFMDENVPISDVVFFLGTNKSVFNSPDCAHELELSEKHKVPVYPMRGTDVTWSDMNSIGLSQDPGMDYTPQNFENVCEQLYEHIKKFYKEYPGLFKVKKSVVEEKLAKDKKIQEEKVAKFKKMDEEIAAILPKDFSWEAFMAVLEYLVDSEDLKNFHKSKEREIINLVKNLKNGSLSDADFLAEVG